MSGRISPALAWNEKSAVELRGVGSGLISTTLAPRSAAITGSEAAAEHRPTSRNEHDLAGRARGGWLLPAFRRAGTPRTDDVGPEQGPAGQDRTPDLEKLASLYDRYFREGLGHELHGGAIQITRVHAAGRGTPREQVAPYEDVRKVLERHDRLYLMPCVCRLHYGRCENSTNVCLSLIGPEAMAHAASHVPVYDPEFAEVRHAIRPISVDEGIDILSQTEREGLVHVTSNHQGETEFICNCCRCCCVLMRSITELAIPFGVAPSAFWMTVDQDTCNGCQDCIERCPVGALEMEKVAGHKKLKAAVNYDLCLGCGVCSFVCEAEAMHPEQRKANIFIPPLNADEMYTIIGGARGRAWPVAPHHH